MRDLVSKVTNGKAADDPDPKVTEYIYTPNGQTDVETKPNGNTVDHDYYWDGLLQHQLETKADGTTVIAEHMLSYDRNGNKTRDVSRVRDADTGELRDRTHTYTYDPRDRTSGVTKTDTSAGTTLSSESYVHDAASNVITQTIDDVTTDFVYDRNRLLTATTSGVTASYNYDPYGRLDTVTSAGTVVERYDYDGFDRIKQHEKLNDTGGTDTTAYTYDPMDRTASTTDKGGETTEFEYLGLSGEVLNESIGGEVQKSYTYSPWGQRLSQIKNNSDGMEESSFYGYSPHTDVETLTTESGDTKATYGYTAYGSDDEDEFTGVDKPDAGTPGEEPYNVYRYSAKRWDAGSGTYDMGFRDYAPGINRFLTRDMYNGALADLNLGMSQWTGNRYALTGGNPTTFVEIDGHKFDYEPANTSEQRRLEGLPFLGEEVFDNGSEPSPSPADPQGTANEVQRFVSVSEEFDEDDMAKACEALGYCDPNAISELDIAAELIGINDAKDCAGGTASGCALTAVTLVPGGAIVKYIGKGGKALFRLLTRGDDANTADRVTGPLWTSTKSTSSAGNALSHFNAHKADFPHLNNSLEYTAEAQSFLHKPPPGTLTITRSNGDVVRYNPQSNLFGVMDSAGAPRTYFRPDPAVHGYPTNLDYFNAQ